MRESAMESGLKVGLGLLLMLFMIGANCDPPPPDTSAKPLAAPAALPANAGDALAKAYGTWRGTGVEGAGPFANLLSKVMGKVTLNLTQSHVTMTIPQPQGAPPSKGSNPAMQASITALTKPPGEDDSAGPQGFDSDYKIIGVDGPIVSIGMGPHMAKLQLKDPNTLAVTDMQNGLTVLFARGLTGQ